MSRRSNRDPDPGLRSSYHPIVGDSPEVKTGDLAAASAHLSRVRRAIDVGGWTRTEWRRLRMLEAKWKARTEGRDVRYNLVGTSKCGLTKEQKSSVRTLQIFKNLQLPPNTKSKVKAKGKGNDNGSRQKPQVQWTD